MFDIGFPELVLVSIIALLVIGPDRLPETIRTVALWVGRLKRSLANIKQEIEKEIGADEIRRELHNESILKELQNTRHDIQDIIDKTDETFTDIKSVAKPIGGDLKVNRTKGQDEVTTDDDRSKSEPGG